MTWYAYEIILREMIAIMLFTSRVAKEIDTLFDLSQNIAEQKISFDQTVNLPEPVKKYFSFALKEGQPYIYSFLSQHEGVFRMKIDKPWSPIQGEDYFTVYPPGFVWVASLKSSPLFWLSIRDCYLQNRGRSKAWAYSLVPVSSVEGPLIDQGALSRWLSTAVFFPTALLPSEKLTWIPIDGNSAQLLFSHQGINIAAQVFFGRRGEIIRLTTNRYYDETHGFVKWSAFYKNYANHQGMEVPMEVGAMWHFESHNFNYIRYRITKIDFNKMLRQ